MPLTSQIARFAIVGVINTAVDLAVLKTLIALSHRGRTELLYSFFKGISFLVAVLNSYCLNSRWALPPNSHREHINAHRPVLVRQCLGLGHQCRHCILGGGLHRTCEMAG